MKISPMPSTMVPATTPGEQLTTHVQAQRTLKMNTNATPLSAPPPQAGEGAALEDSDQTTAPVEATQPLSPQLAFLAKQRRALQVKERELKAREKAMTQQNLDKPVVDVARLKAEPIRVLLEHGVTYEQLAQAITSGQGGNSEIYALKAEIESLKTGIDQKFTEKATAEEQQALAQMKRDAESLVTSDDYELIRATRSIPTVMSLIERTYRQSGEVLDVQEAMKLVEDELLKDAQKIQTLKKLQQQSQQPLMHQPQQRPQGTRTLTNRQTASVPMSAKQRALAAFYGNLKR